MRSSCRRARCSRSRCRSTGAPGSRRRPCRAAPRARRSRSVAPRRDAGRCRSPLPRVPRSEPVTCCDGGRPGYRSRPMSAGRLELAQAWITAGGAPTPPRCSALSHPDAVDHRPGRRQGPSRQRRRLRPRRARRGQTRRDRVAGAARADSAAVAAVWSDGTERLDTLIVADDGRIVRVMVHRV